MGIAAILVVRGVERIGNAQGTKRTDGIPV
jgi:hypothetical protein